jgi:Putative restriction endonuclease
LTSQFCIAPASTKDQDEGFKKDLYEQLGVEEYWQFDPKQDWIDGQLRGYRLVGDGYVPMVSDRPEVIGNHQSTALGLRLEPAGALIAFYRLDNGEKLLIPVELRARAQNLQASLQLAEAELLAERSRTEALQLLVDRYRNQFGDL